MQREGLRAAPEGAGRCLVSWCCSSGSQGAHLLGVSLIHRNSATNTGVERERRETDRQRQRERRGQDRASQPPAAPGRQVALSQLSCPSKPVHLSQTSPAAPMSAEGPGLTRLWGPGWDSPQALQAAVGV